MKRRRQQRLHQTKNTWQETTQIDTLADETSHIMCLYCRYGISFGSSRPKLRLHVSLSVYKATVHRVMRIEYLDRG